MSKLALDVDGTLPLLKKQAGERMAEAVWREMQRQTEACGSIYVFKLVERETGCMP